MFSFCICGWWVEMIGCFFSCVVGKNGWKCVVLCTEVIKSQRSAFISACFKSCEWENGKVHSCKVRTHCSAHHVLVVDACLVSLYDIHCWKPPHLRVVGHKAHCTLVDYLLLCLFVLQGHKWIWGNQEICGHKVSTCVPAASTALRQ